jgi:hypothetical protein
MQNVSESDELQPFWTGSSALSGDSTFSSNNIHISKFILLKVEVVILQSIYEPQKQNEKNSQRRNGMQ